MGTGMEVVVDRHAGQRQEGWSHVGRCRSTFRVRGEDTVDIRSHRLIVAHVCVGSRGNLSVFHGRPSHGMLREVSGSISMQPVGCTQRSYTDATNDGTLLIQKHFLLRAACP